MMGHDAVRLCSALSRAMLCRAITHSKQEQHYSKFVVIAFQAALKVLFERAKEIGASLHMAPPLESYDWGQFPPDLGLFRDVHSYNASLALQLARYFLTRQMPSNNRGDDENLGFALKWQEALGLRLCFWPGRCHVVKREKKSQTYFLDGAHTEQSMWACRTWFDHTREELNNSSHKVLLFNSTGDRNPETLLAPLANFPFDVAIFCTNETKHEDISSDNTNLNFSFGYALRKCEANQVTKSSTYTTHTTLFESIF